MKNAFHDLISTLDKTEERVSEHEDRPMETSPTDAQREWIKEKLKKKGYSKLMRQLQVVYI